MKNLKLEDRISANYALLFLVLILVSNIILVYSLQRQSNKVLEISAGSKMEEINSFLDKVGIFSDKTNVLTLDFNPEVVEGKKVIHVKPFNPGEDNYLYVLEIKLLSVTSSANIFSKSIACLFILFIVSFTVQKLISLARSHLFIFALIPIGLGN